MELNFVVEKSYAKRELFYDMVSRINDSKKENLGKIFPCYSPEVENLTC